jgi:guanylate kinase
MNLQEAIQNYKMPEEAKDLIRSHKPIGLAGPTGAGKGTLSQYLTQTGEYAPIVSDTTRSPRPLGRGCEVNGVHYWFLSDDEALQKLQSSKYIEAKLVHGTTVYGTSIEAYKRVVDVKRIPILEIDVQGMEEFMRVDPDFISIMLLPPDFKTWIERLDGRGVMDPSEKARRLNTAIFELDKLFGNERFFPVINTEVIDTYEVIRSGSYRNESYRNEAMEIAGQLRQATKEFLNI